jgi:dUTPase
MIDIDFINQEIELLVHNLSNTPYTIDRGDRVCQITLLEHRNYLLGIDSDDVRTGGFGSTGKD